MVRQRIQRFEAVVHEIVYATRTSEGVCLVAGRPLQMIPGEGLRPLWRRLILASAVALAILIVGLVVSGHYTARAPWFVAHGNGGGLLMAGLVAALAAGHLTAARWLPARARRPLVRAPGLWLLVASCLTMAALWGIGGPRAEGVEVAIRRGDLEGARLELAALTAIDPAAEGIAVVRARLNGAEAQVELERGVAADEARIADLQGTGSAVDALAALEHPWRTEALAGRAREAALALARGDLDRLDRARDTAGLTALAEAVAPVDPGLGAEAKARSHLARAFALGAKEEYAGALAVLDGEWPAAPTTEADRDTLRHEIEGSVRRKIAALGPEALDRGKKDLAARRQAIISARDLTRLLESRGLDAEAPSSAELTAVLTAVEKAIATEDARAERAERRARAAEEARLRRAAESRRRDAAEYRSNRVRCCDGTLSPSCSYGGPRRGCCSSHGGMC